MRREKNGKRNKKLRSKIKSRPVRIGNLRKRNGLKLKLTLTLLSNKNTSFASILLDKIVA